MSKLVSRRKVLAISVSSAITGLLAACQPRAAAPASQGTSAANLSLTRQALSGAISDLYILVGENNNPPPGFTKIQKDLNEGVGGEYLYLCYKTGGTEPITAMFVGSFNYKGGDDIPGYTKLDTDLNLDAGGRFVYLYYSKIPQLGPPIQASKLIFQTPSDICIGCNLLEDMNAGTFKDKPIRLSYPDGSVVLGESGLSVDTVGVITDLTVIHGEGFDVFTPDGYTRNQYDLNENAGGEYIYLCYKRGGTTPITALWIGAFTTTELIKLPGYTRIEVDLNKGARGPHIYLYYSKLQSLGLPIADLTVGQWLFRDANPGMTLLGQDLNEGNGGTTIRLGYQRVKQN